MGLQVCGSFRGAICRKISRCPAHNPPDLTNPNSSKAGKWQLANAHRKVKAFLNHVHDPIDHLHIRTDDRMCIQEFSQDRGHIDAPEFIGASDPKLSNRIGRGFFGRIILEQSGKKCSLNFTTCVRAL